MPWDLNGNPNINQNNFLGTRNNQSLRIRTNADANGNDAMTITPAPNANTTGKVGIGSNRPGSNLTVNVPGSSTPVSALSVDVQSFGTLANARASHYFRVRDIGAAPPDGRTDFLIRGDGNVAIGSTDTGLNTKLHVKQFADDEVPTPVAVHGESTHSIGVRGTGVTGVRGEGTGAGVAGFTTQDGGTGVHGEVAPGSSGGKAGTFVGDVFINGNVGIHQPFPEVLLHAVGDSRIRLQEGGGDRTLDLRSDGAALDIESNGPGSSGDLFINGNNRKVLIPNLEANLVESSSRVNKENIADFTVEEAIVALDGLNPILFNRKNDEEKKTRLGFVAEDTPEIATTSDKTAIVPTHILAILSKVVQEQQRMITSMRSALGLQSST